MHTEALQIYTPQAREGVEFAEEERLFHLRKIYACDAAGRADSQWASQLVVALLQEAEVEEARVVLSTTKLATVEILYSRALLAFVDSHKRSDDDGDDDSEVDSGDEMGLAPIDEVDEGGEGAEAGSASGDVRAGEAELAAAIAANPYVVSEYPPTILPPWNHH